LRSIRRRIINQLLRYYLLVPHTSTICTYLMYSGTNSYISDTLVVSLLHIIASHLACHIALILDTPPWLYSTIREMSTHIHCEQATHLAYSTRREPNPQVTSTTRSKMLHYTSSDELHHQHYILLYGLP